MVALAPYEHALALSPKPRCAQGATVAASCPKLYVQNLHYRDVCKVNSAV